MWICRKQQPNQQWFTFRQGTVAHTINSIPTQVEPESIKTWFLWSRTVFVDCQYMSQEPRRFLQWTRQTRSHTQRDTLDKCRIQTSTHTVPYYPFVYPTNTRPSIERLGIAKIRDIFVVILICNDWFVSLVMTSGRISYRYPSLKVFLVGYFMKTIIFPIDSLWKQSERRL